MECISISIPNKSIIIYPACVLYISDEEASTGCEHLHVQNAEHLPALYEDIQVSQLRTCCAHLHSFLRLIIWILQFMIYRITVCLAFYRLHINSLLYFDSWILQSLFKWNSMTYFTTVYSYSIKSEMYLFWVFNSFEILSHSIMLDANCTSIFTVLYTTTYMKLNYCLRNICSCISFIFISIISVMLLLHNRGKLRW